MRERTKEHCLNISKAKTGKKNPKFSEWAKIHYVGEGNPMFGRTRPDLSERNRISPPMLGKKRPRHSKRMKESNPSKRFEVKEKIREKLSTPEARQQMRERMTGENNPMKRPEIAKKVGVAMNLFKRRSDDFTFSWAGF